MDLGTPPKSGGEIFASLVKMSFKRGLKEMEKYRFL
jgi:hypothetical protein